MSSPGGCGSMDAAVRNIRSPERVIRATLADAGRGAERYHLAKTGCLSK